MIKYMLLFIPWSFESVKAQNLQLNANIGYYTGATLKASQGRFLLRNGTCYSAGLSYKVKEIKKQKNICFELQYSYVSSSMRFERYNTTRKINLGNMRIHTFLVGAGKQFGKGAVQPYGTAMMGAALFDPDSLDHVKRLTFSFSFTTGIKIALVPVMGVFLQAQALLPVMYNRVYVGWEPDNGLATAVAPIGVLFSGYFTGGLYFNLVQ
jgi:hypothetical protein